MSSFCPECTSGWNSDPDVINSMSSPTCLFVVYLTTLLLTRTTASIKWDDSENGLERMGKLSGGRQIYCPRMFLEGLR